MNKIPKEEMLQDLELTQRDISRLDSIIANLTLFIRDSGGENRGFLKIDLLKYEALRDDAWKLLTEITKRWESA